MVTTFTLTRPADAHLVIVAVRILALTFVIAEVVSGGEAVFHGDFEHIYFLLAFLESDSDDLPLFLESESDLDFDSPSVFGFASDFISALSECPLSVPLFPLAAFAGVLA